MFEISDAFPIPRVVNTKERQRFPFKTMQVGESFWMPAPHGGQTLEVRSARVAASVCAKNYGFKFTSKSEGGGVRFWRVA